MTALRRRRGLQGTAHAARRRMGLNPTPEALSWATRVMVRVHRVLSACPDDAEHAVLVATLARMEGMEPSWRHARNLIRAGARSYQ